MPCNFTGLMLFMPQKYTCIHLCDIMFTLGLLTLCLSSRVKFRAYPTEKQEEVLSQWVGC